MTATENKNQLTLYRFVSLRSPELSKKENQEKRFVFHLDNRTGVFFDAINNKPENQSNWVAMQNASKTFNAIQNESELESNYTEFYKVAEWISINRSNNDTTELLKKIKSVSVLNDKIELDLWDNLFYQVVTQKSFYVKEAIMQILVLQNLLKQIDGIIDDKEIVKYLYILSNSKVVLPKILFQESLDNSITSTVNKEIQQDEKIVINKELIDAQIIQSSKNNINNLENLIEELKLLEKNYFINYQKQHDQEIKLYQDRVFPIIETYQKDYDLEKRKLCDIPRDENYNPNDICYQPNVESPKIPEFIFNYPIEFDINVIQRELSEENFETLSQLIGKNLISSYETAINLVIKEIDKKSVTISQRTITKEKIISIGDTILSTSKIIDNSTGIPFQICASRLGNGNVNMYLQVQLNTNNLQIESFSYAKYDNTGIELEDYFINSYNGNVLTLGNLYNNNLAYNQFVKITRLSGTFTFTNGQQYTFDINPFLPKTDSCNLGMLNSIGDGDTNDPNQIENNSFIPKGFGYKQLGIADYKKVVAEVCCYDAGEVAHIENVMASELRSKVTTKTFKSEVTDFESTEIERENMTDVVSTERFEMQTEVTKLLAQQKQMSAYADIHSLWGNTTLDAGVAYATNTSKEESNRQAVNQAKELTQRAVEKIVSRVKTEKTVKIINEFVEENTHAFDNRGNSEHISGVFRFINAIYKNQIFNYGKRLMYEFTVPQPSKLHQLAMQVSANNQNTLILEKPIDPATLGINDFTKISLSNYQNLSSKYNADVEVYPQTLAYINKTASSIQLGNQEIIENSSEIQIPAGFQPVSAKLKFAAKWDSDGGQSHSVNIAFGNYALYAQGLHSNINETNLIGFQYEYALDSFADKINFSYGLANYHSCNISLSIKIQVTPQTIENWKKETYNKIIKGYQELLRLYNENLTQAKVSGVQILDSNPLFYRQIEQMVLRKNCISYLLDNSTTSSRRFGRKMYTGDSITTHQVTANQEMDNYGSFAKFMEQAFEWNLMSYNFYPFYWGNDSEWSSLYQHESNDPIFRSFMQAGMARVVVTVKPGFEDAIMHYLTTGQIWNGGQTPILGDPLYLSIVDELKEQEYTIEEIWKTVVPTNLIGLQRSGVSVAEDGLPCDCPVVDELNKTLVINDKVLIAKE